MGGAQRPRAANGFEVDTNCMLALLSFEYNSEVKVVIPSIFMFISVLCLDRLL
ncbi:hypothetical protein ACJX0J_036091, partial [Zea mays]